MSLRKQLKGNKTVRGRRWTINRDKNDNLTGVKMIFEPETYVKYKSAKPMYGDKALLKILEDENKKNNS